jgi:uncharacterized protein (DUF2147 family)
MIASPLHTKALPQRRRGRPGFGLIGLVATLIGIALAEPAVAAPAEDIAGQWLTDDGEGVIDIRPCGEQRCGRIAWMKDPKGADGKPPLDHNNPNPSLRSRPICGLQIISGLKAQADGSWGEGRVYDPDSGKTYDMEIRREAPDVIKATGYMGFKMLGQTREWRRAPKNLGSCDAPAAAAKR